MTNLPKDNLEERNSIGQEPMDQPQPDMPLQEPRSMPQPKEASVLLGAPEKMGETASEIKNECGKRISRMRQAITDKVTPQGDLMDEFKQAAGEYGGMLGGIGKMATSPLLLLNQKSRPEAAKKSLEGLSQFSEGVVGALSMPVRGGRRMTAKLWEMLKKTKDGTKWIAKSPFTGLSAVATGIRQLPGWLKRLDEADLQLFQSNTLPPQGAGKAPSPEGGTPMPPPPSPPPMGPPPAGPGA